MLPAGRVRVLRYYYITPARAGASRVASCFRHNVKMNKGEDDQPLARLECEQVTTVVRIANALLIQHG